MCVRLAAFLCISFALLGSAFADDPKLKYKTLETPHFSVHYYEGLEEFALKVAITAEEAHTILVPLLDWVPDTKTQVVINDKVDTANGSATVFGRSHMNIFAMAPEADSSLGFFDDWIRILVFHEYVHILHLDTVGGLPMLSKFILGKQWAPNQTMPRWYTEGLATYHESRRTRGGRVDASLFQMYLRAAAYDDTLYDFGAATNLPIRWPSGTVAYLYGSSFLDYVFRKHGEEFAPKFNHIYGRRIIPWGLNNIARDVAGEDFDTLWGQWTAELKGEALASRVAVKARGETHLEWVTDRGVDIGPPRLRPNHEKLTYHRHDHRRQPAIVETDPADGSTNTILKIEGTSPGYTWTADGENLIYTQSVTHKNTYRYRDLYVWNAKRKTTNRLTRQERAREPAVAPNGRLITYVRNRKGTMELVVRDLRHISGKEKVLISGLNYDSTDERFYQQISLPHFGPNSERIVFSWWRLDRGQRDLWIVDVKTGELQQLTNDFAMDMEPFWHEDGTIYFTSDRSGIYNIYSVDPKKPIVRELSNVATGVFSPVVSPDGAWIYVRGFQPHGFDIARFRMPGKTYVAQPSQKENTKIEYPDVDTSTFETTPYRPAKYLGPLFISPQFGVLLRGAGFGGNVTGFDPVGHHSYSLNAGYSVGRDLEEQGTSVSLSYAYAGLPIGLTFSGLFRDRPRTRDLFVESDFFPYLRREYLGRIGTSLPFRALDDTLSIGLSFNVAYLDFAETLVFNHEPGDLEPLPAELGWRNGLAFTVAYSNVDSFPLSVSPQRGWRGSTTVDLRRPEFGSDFSSTTFSFRFDGYLQNYWWPRHALNLHLDGAFSTSSVRNPSGFSLGGNSPQDVFTSILFQEQRRRFLVRGYEPNVTRGNQFFLAGAEYRFPVWDFKQGFSTVPVFFRQLKGSMFLESGAAYSGFLADADLKTGLGAELSLEAQFAYYLFGNIRLGYARGLDDDGIHEIYFRYGGGF